MKTLLELDRGDGCATPKLGASLVVLSQRTQSSQKLEKGSDLSPAASKENTGDLPK